MFSLSPALSPSYRAIFLSFFYHLHLLTFHSRLYLNVITSMTLLIVTPIRYDHSFEYSGTILFVPLVWYFIPTCIIVFFFFFWWGEWSCPIYPSWLFKYMRAGMLSVSVAYIVQLIVLLTVADWYRIGTQRTNLGRNIIYFIAWLLIWHLKNTWF